MIIYFILLFFQNIRFHKGFDVFATLKFISAANLKDQRLKHANKNIFPQKCGKTPQDSVVTLLKTAWLATQRLVYSTFSTCLCSITTHSLTHSPHSLVWICSIIPHIVILCHWKTRQKCPQNDTFSFVRNPAGITSLTLLLPPSATRWYRRHRK